MVLINNASRRLVTAWFTFFALCSTSVHLVAEHGRNFAGEFQIRDVADEGSVVKFELHVKVFNFSGTDVKDATLTLVDRMPGPNPDADYQGSFTDVSILYRKSVELDGSFMVPAREYHEWQRGAVPNLVVTYTGESGKELRNSVELRPALGGLPKGESR
jgi:hypothetical protein